MSWFPVSVLLLAAALGGLVATSVTDIKSRLIHNEVVLYLLVVGVALRLISTPGLLWLSLLVSVLLLVLLGRLAHSDIIGGGDAKLTAAAMLLLPPQHVLQLMANIAVAGGLLGCIYLAARIALKKTAAVQTVPERIHQTAEPEPFFRNELAKIGAGEPMPYALAVTGGVAYSIATEVMQCIYATSCSL